MICCVTGHRPKGFPFVRNEDSLEYCNYLKKMMEMVDELICEGYQTYYRGCMHKRNRYMVDKADLVLAVWNGVCSGGTWETIKYARKNGKIIRYIMLNEISSSQS